MPALKNQRHEKFTLALFEGKSATEAYALAGYRPCRQNAARLMSNDVIRQRLSELQGGAAKSAAITVQSIVDELDEAIAVAKNAKQATAMVSAAALKSKLAGLLIERVETGQPGSFDDLHSTAAIADRVLETVIEKFIPVDEADRQGLIDLYTRHLQETEEFLASIRARPIVAERVDARNLKADWRQLERYSAQSQFKAARRLNGNKPPAQPIEREVKVVRAEE
jgi:hypothetical protein